MMKGIFNILFSFNQHKTQKGNNKADKHGARLAYAICAIIAVAIGATVGINYYQTYHPPQMQSVQQNAQINTGAATSSQMSGQETIGGEWYAIGKGREFDLQNYGITAQIAVGGSAHVVDDSIEVVLSDYNVLYKQKKYLTINIKFKVRGEDTIYETGARPLVFNGMFADGIILKDWHAAIDKPVNANDVVWQVEFGTTDMPKTKSKTKVIVK